MSVGVQYALTDAGTPAAHRAMQRYFRELEERFPDGFDARDALDDAAEQYNPPRGAFFLAVLGADHAGCGAVHHLDVATSEIKRMWVDPRHRGRGIGAGLLERLEDEARRAGAARVVLDTNSVLTEALHLYRSRGYQPIERYNDNPHAQLWFEKLLGGSGRGAAGHRGMPGG